MNQFSYFSDIEEAFIRCRGRNLFVSSKDWQLIDTWQRRGIPQHVVINAIEEVFRKRDSRHPVTSLAYCGPAVEERFKVWADNRVGASNEPDAYVESANDPRCNVCGKEYCLRSHRESLDVT